MQPQAALSLLFEFTRAEGAEDPYAFRAGPQVYILRGEGGGAETATLDWDAGLLADLTATQRPGVDPAVTQRLGDRMRAFLNQTGWTRYEQRILQAVAEGRPIGLTFRSNAAELYSLPWELLTLRSTGQALGELPGLLLRQAWPETTTHPEEPMPRGEGGRILFAWAGQVPAAEHERAIRAACERGNHPFDASRDVLPNASPERLLRRLRDSEAGPVAVLHLLCHGLRGGETYGLALERDDGLEDHVLALELHPDDGERDDGHEIRQDRSERSGAVPPRRVQVGRRQAGDRVEEDLRQHQVQQIGDDLQLDERGCVVAALGGEPAVQVVVDREGRGEGQEGQERGRDESDRDQDRRRLGVVLLPGPDEQRDERRRQHPADHELEDEVRRRVRLGVEVGEWGLADGIREDEHAGEPCEPAQSGAGGHPDALASGATGGGADRVGRHGRGPDVVGH